MINQNNKLEWTKRQETNSLAEIVMANTKMSQADLLNDTRTYYYPNLDKAEELVRKHISLGNKITVYSDYDVDGVMSAKNLKNAFVLYQYKAVEFVSPRRFTDGYGVNVARVKDFYDNGTKLIITIDNGIAALDAIKLARGLGMDVIVLDHHQPVVVDGEVILPEANVICDPHVTGGYEIGNPSHEFTDLCGAGIGYYFTVEVAKHVNVPEQYKTMLVEESLIGAAIATIADVVSLVDDNRNIVKRGLALLNQNKGFAGVRALLDVMNISKVRSEDIAFGVAPCINASGRLYDSGAQTMFELVTCLKNKELATVLAEKAKEANDERKAETKDAVDRAIEYFEKNSVGNAIVYVDKIGSGIAGLVAAKLSELFYKPTAVLTQTARGDYKGSGRSIDEVDLKAMLDKCQSATDCFVGYGGHPGAAGLTVKADKLDDFVEALNKFVPLVEAPKTIYYDIELKPVAKDVLDNVAESDLYEPYGASNPAPLYCMKHVVLGDELGTTHKYMGSENQHVKFFVSGEKNLEIVWFNGAEEYKALGEPKCIDVLGTIGTNTFKGNTKAQVKVSNLRVCED